MEHHRTETVIMMILAVAAMLVGAALGLKFKVLILLPAIVIGLAVIFAAGLFGLSSQGHFMLAAALATVALQIGYLAGIVIRSLTVAGAVPGRPTCIERARGITKPMP